MWDDLLTKPVCKLHLPKRYSGREHCAWISTYFYQKFENLFLPLLIPKEPALPLRNPGSPVDKALSDQEATWGLNAPYCQEIRGLRKWERVLNHTWDVFNFSGNYDTKKAKINKGTHSFEISEKGSFESNLRSESRGLYGHFKEVGILKLVRAYHSTPLATPVLSSQHTATWHRSALATGLWESRCFSEDDRHTKRQPQHTPSIRLTEGFQNS